jgi:glycosyl transferase family 1
MSEEARERRRLQRQRQARLRHWIDETARRAASLEQAAGEMREAASRYRRALAVVLGSEAWDAIVLGLRRLRSGAATPAGHAGSVELLSELERGRRRRDRAARRLGAYAEGTAELRRSLLRRLPRGRSSGDPEPPIVRGPRTGLATRAAIALRVAAPDIEAAMRGGDYHLAGSLASALRRRGYEARVETAAEEAEKGAVPELRIVLRGRHAIPPRPGIVNLLWIISHPAAVTAAELNGFDCVLTCSARHASELRRLTGVPVRVMPQFADGRFAELRPRRERHDLLFVGNWRGVYRRIVWDAHCLGWRPALVGDGWRYIAPGETIAAHAPYSELPTLYRSARILLVDHWDDMRERGYVANRVFDALASGVFVVADDVQGLGEMLPGGLETYRTLPELDRLLRRYLADPDRRASVAARGRELVLASHTVEHRADQLLRAIHRALAAADR